MTVSQRLGSLARRLYSCFDDDAEKANVRVSVNVASGHADARTRAVMTDYDNDHDANDANFSDTFGKILGATVMAWWPCREATHNAS